MAVVWSRRACADLAAIFSYIAADNRAAAERWVARLVTRGNAVDSFPLAGRAVPELGRSDIRETFLRTYRIIYRVEGTEIEILTVFEGHRRLRPFDFDDSR